MSETQSYRAFECGACDGRGTDDADSACLQCGGIGSFAPEDVTPGMERLVVEDEI